MCIAAERCCCARAAEAQLKPRADPPVMASNELKLRERASSREKTKSARARAVNAFSKGASISRYRDVLAVRARLQIVGGKKRGRNNFEAVFRRQFKLRIDCFFLRENLGWHLTKVVAQVGVSAEIFIR